MSKSLSIYKVRRIVALISAVIAFGVWVFANYQMPDPETNAGTEVAENKSGDSKNSGEADLATVVLDSLEEKEKYTGERYYRKKFYDNWGEIDGCRTREVILKRDLHDTVMNGCKVMSGILNDPYTGKEIQFVRGQQTSQLVQIDHVVALSNAWATGAYLMSSEERYALSQDPLNLIAVDGKANQNKSNQDASSWLPENKNFQCEYVARQISVKHKYHLWVTSKEKSAMKYVLSTCPTQKILNY